MNDAHIPKTTLLDVLLDGIKGLLFGDLHLRVGPPRDLDDHIQDDIVLVGEEGDVVEGGHDGTIVLNENTVLCKDVQGFDQSTILKVWCQHSTLTECVGRANEAGGVRCRRDVSTVTDKESVGGGRTGGHSRRRRGQKANLLR
jgi:hypothetical protein